MAEEKKVGVVYVLTNEAMPAWVKIGYADNLEKRIAELSNKSAVPLSFKAYAYYETPYRLVDNDVKELIDIINPDLRAVEYVNGRKKKREFYQMTPDKAYQILCALANFHHTTPPVLVQDGVPLPAHSTSKTEKNETNAETKKEETSDKRISKEAISFTKCGIPEGAELTYDGDSSIKAYVKGKNKVIYNNEEYSLTGLTKKIRNDNTAVRGPLHWKYKGELLTDIRKRKEQEGTYK